MNENKHYIRLDSDGYIIHGYSDAFESFVDGDICINKSGGRQFVMMGVVNPSIISLQGGLLYKYIDGQIVEQAKPMPIPPKAITESERISALETALDELMGVVLNV